MTRGIENDHSSWAVNKKVSAVGKKKKKNRTKVNLLSTVENAGTQTIQPTLPV